MCFTVGFSNLPSRGDILERLQDLTKVAQNNEGETDLGWAKNYSYVGRKGKMSPHLRSCAEGTEINATSPNESSIPRRSKLKMGNQRVIPIVLGDLDRAMKLVIPSLNSRKAIWSGLPERIDGHWYTHEYQKELWYLWRRNVQIPNHKYPESIYYF